MPVADSTYFNALSHALSLLPQNTVLHSRIDLSESESLYKEMDRLRISEALQAPDLIWHHFRMRK